jgi:hypothetical protein
MIYAAMRVAQGDLVGQCRIEVEEISTEKSFPKMAAACHDFTIAGCTVEVMIWPNPGKRLKRPQWKGLLFTTINLDNIRVRRRNGGRRRRRFCKVRRKWKSIRHVRGGRKLGAMFIRVLFPRPRRLG